MNMQQYAASTANMLNELAELDPELVVSIVRTQWSAHVPHHAVEYMATTNDGGNAMSHSTNLLGVVNGMTGPHGWRIAVNTVQGRYVFSAVECDPAHYKVEASEDSQDS